MFKFLKNKLKKFENKLEAELQTELEKELNVIEPEKPIKKTEGRPKNIDKSVAEETKEKAAEFKSKEMKEEKKIKKSKKPEELERKKRLEKEKRKREEQIDKQIERSIETELQHVLRTKKGIESVVKTVRKKSRGISEEKLDELLWDLEVGLLESDVAYSVIESIKDDIKEELMHVSFERSKVGDLVEDVLRNAIAHVLKSSEIDFLIFFSSFTSFSSFDLNSAGFSFFSSATDLSIYLGLPSVFLIGFSGSAKCISFSNSVCSSASSLSSNFFNLFFKNLNMKNTQKIIILFLT